MSTNTISAQELSARTDTWHRLGTDTKARRHYADPLLGAVWVTVDDRIAHVEQTGDVEQWVHYTAEHVGWKDCQYSTKSTAEWLADILTDTAAQEGELTMHHAPLEQTLTSCHIDTGTITQCTECQTTLGECDLVTIRLRHADQSPSPDLRACYCLGCAPTSFDERLTTAQTETLAEARLGIAQDSHRQAPWLIPVSPTVIATTRATHPHAHAVSQGMRE